MRVLLIEDDAILADVLSQSLANQHYVVDWAEEGQLGWEYAQEAEYDLIVMDVGLPKLDGITLCQRLRSKGYSTPILLMTAKDATGDRIRGLDAGADDYVIKPFDLGEFQARVRALLRRGEVAPNPILQVGALKLDPSRCEVTYGSKLLALTPKEYSLLELFLRNPTRVFSRGNIIEHLWTYDDPPQEESVKAHIKGLRQKLKAVGAADWIENVYGLGYRLKPGVERVEEPLETAKSVEVATPPIEEQFNQAMSGLWERYQGLMAERVAVLQQADASLQTDTLSPELRHSAERAAHKLAGVLGMFERETGTQLARQLEKLLLGTDPLSRQQQQEARSLIQAVIQSIGLPETESVQSSISQAIELQFEEGRPSPRETAKPSQGVKVLVVDDDPIILSAVRTLLEPWGMRVFGLDNPLRFWEVVPDISPDLLILDVEMPQLSGVELCRTVRNNVDWQSLPVLFLTAHREPQIVQDVFESGADDYIVKPVIGAELVTRITNRLERNRLLQTYSTKNPLTGLDNQPQSNLQLEHLLKQAANQSTSVCLALFAVSQLRQINFEYGHAIGNQVLQRWGHLFQAAFPGNEILGYWGNGEFVVGLPGLTKAEAIDRLAPLQTTLRQQIFTTLEGDRFEALCDVAMVEYPQDGETLRSLYQAASSKLTMA